MWTLSENYFEHFIPKKNIDILYEIWLLVGNNKF